MNQGSFVFIIFGLIITIVAQPHGYDDDGEMSVPRSPKIQGPDKVTLPYIIGKRMKNLTCHIEGSPTPTVIWLKDGQEIHEDKGPYNMTYNVTDGTAELKFLTTAYSDDSFITGHFTCIAANFLGRAQKVFYIEAVADIESSSTAATTSNFSTTTNTSFNSTNIVQTTISMEATTNFPMSYNSSTRPTSNYNTSTHKNTSNVSSVTWKELPVTESYNLTSKKPI